MAKMLKPYSRGRAVSALLISLVPLNGLRVALYKAVMGYSFGSDAHIGLLTIIACESFQAGRGLRLGRNNKFVGPMCVELGESVIIGRFNKFSCGSSAADPGKAHMNYGRSLVIGDRVLINDDHYFDVYGSIHIGDGTWIAGAGSQFWTHGASVMDRDIAIGPRCYVGSAVRFAPGASIGNGCVLGLGSVVVARIEENEAVLGGFPARKIRNIGSDDGRQFLFDVS
jgi:acetyltransferase-like isoleucine patch superfamily enzyme